jgi:subtilisin family serine protease
MRFPVAAVLAGVFALAPARTPAAPIVVAVVDTGANVAVPVIAASRPATYDVHTHTRGVYDENGHGTRVASIVAATSGNARLLLVKAGSASGAFSDANEAAAIHYAVARGAWIVNLSLGGPRTSLVERRAIQYATDRGVLVVAAAGDDFAERPEYPAALLEGTGLAVAATLRDGAHAAFSNTGSWVSVAAPAEDGTSFAAALVSGAAARVWAANPALSAKQIVRVIEETASGHGLRTDVVGYGLIDVTAAIARARALR